jgi:HK97 gp10 family phage protein
MEDNSVSFEVRGLKELDDALLEIGNAAAGKALFSSLMAAGLPIQKTAQSLAPKAEHAYYRYSKGGKKLGGGAVSAKSRKLMQPGTLRKSIRRKKIKSDTGETGAKIEISWRGDGFYGDFYERGSSKQAAKPFLRPAFDAKKNDALDIFKEKLAANIEKQRRIIAARTAGLAT